MKQVVRLGILSLLAAIGLFSCEEVKPLDMAEVDRFQDSILQMIPTASVQVKEARDFNTEEVTLKLIIGDTHFYDASPEKMHETAIKAGKLVLSIFTSKIKGGQLIVTKERINHPNEDPTDGIKTDMKLDSLKAATGK